MSDLATGVLTVILAVLAFIAMIVVAIVMAVLVYGFVFIVWFLVLSLVLYPFDLEPVVLAGNSFSWPFIGSLVCTLIAFAKTKVNSSSK